MKDSILNRLDREFGKKVLFPNNIPEKFFYDESTIYWAKPEAVFLPEEDEEIRAFIKIAYEEGINLIPRGLGTGVCGGAVAYYGGVVVSLERMKAILEVDEANMVVKVQPGLCTNDLKKILESRGFYYPPDPQSYESSSIGGNVATNAGGPRAIKYGTTKNYVMSLKVFTGKGEVLVTGGKTYKNSSGYNLIELFCGSEGTLGIISEIILRFIPKPPIRKLLFIPFRTLLSACDFLREAIFSGLNFSAFEFIDDTAKGFVENFLKRRLPYSDISQCYIFAELEGEMDIVKIADLATKFGAIDIYTATDKGQEERLWEARKKVSEAFKAYAKKVYKADIVVPRGKIADFVNVIKGMSSEELPIACFGHVGDGNVHVNILDCDGSHVKEAEEMMKTVMEWVKRYGGFPSGEHGIGISKKEFMSFFFSPAYISILREVKKVFDPKNIMNPGKVI